jgi:hypothetical protein
MSMTAPSNINDRNKIFAEAQKFVESAINSQATESVQKAAHSFDWVFSDRRSEVKEVSSNQHPGMIGPAAHALSPADYMSYASAKAHSFSKLGEIVPMNDVLHHVRNKSFHYQEGIKGFLQSGIREALAGFKTVEGAADRSSLIPSGLNELLAPDKLKTADPAALKESIKTVNKMFQALKNVQDSNASLKANMLQFVRC